MAKKKDNKNLIIISSIIAVVFVLGIVFSDSIKSTGEAILRKTVKEKVACVFDGSNTEQECSSNYGSCRGISSCSVKVKGEKGKRINWYTTCNGYSVQTTIDGKNENAIFKCSIYAENVECIFSGSNAKKSCQGNSDDASFVCSGVGSCSVRVTGKYGETVKFFSTECPVDSSYMQGGFYYADINGIDEKVFFNCQNRCSDNGGKCKRGSVCNKARVTGNCDSGYICCSLSDDQQQEQDCNSKGSEYKWVANECRYCGPSPHYKWTSGNVCKPSCGWAGGQCNNGKCYKCSNGLCSKEELDVWDC